jgi:hypothetical protein
LREGLNTLEANIIIGEKMGLLELKDTENTTFIRYENRYYIRMNTENEKEKLTLEAEILNENEKYSILNLKLFIGIMEKKKGIVKISLMRNLNYFDLFISISSHGNIKTIRKNYLLLNTYPLEFEDENMLIYFLKNIRRYIKKIVMLTLLDKEIRARNKTKNEIMEIISQL